MFSSWDLRKVIELIWRQRVAMGATLVAAFVTALIYMHVATPTYTVSLQLVPAPSSGQTTGGLGALGALAGINLNRGGDATTFKVYLAGLQSHAAGEMLAKDQSLLKKMYPDQWSERDNAWHQPGGLLRPAIWLVKEILGIRSDPWQPPSADTVNTYLQNNITVMESRDTPLVTVSMRSADRKFASDFLLVLTKDVDRLMRDRALNRANNYIAFITEELRHVTVAEYRSALLEHLFDEEKSRMMASANNVTFAAEVFSGPMSLSHPTSPSLPSTFVVAFLLGCIFGVGFALFLDSRGKVLVIPWSFHGIKAIIIKRSRNLAQSLVGIR